MADETDRFGLSPKQYAEYIDRYGTLCRENPRTRSGTDGLVFFDWEAAALRRVLDAFPEDEEVRSVLCQMMSFVHTKDRVAGR